MKNVKTIYLADDDDDDRMLIRDAIESIVEDVRIIEVTNGKELLELVSTKSAEDNPSLILLDMNMPRMTGIESLLLLKSNPANHHIPIVMISTSSNQKLIRQAYAQGINAYIAKPVLFREYSALAEAVNVCFLNNHPTPVFTEKSYRITTKNILIVEDNDDHWEIMNLSLSLTMPNVTVSRTRDLNSTLNFLMTCKDMLQPMPELLLLDLYLPTQQAGLEVLKAARSFLSAYEGILIPIIILSSSDLDDDIKASYRNHASAYMVKSPDLSGSFGYMKDLCHFWLTTNIPYRHN